MPAYDYRLIVFDLDGTLIESRRDLADAANLLVDHYGGRRLDEAAVIGMVGEGADVLVRRVMEASGIGQPPADAYRRFIAIYHEVMLRHTFPYPGVAETLEALDGRFEMSVLSNKPRESCRIILEELGLARHFRRIDGGDGPWPKKPDPAGLLAVVDEVSASGRAILVGDSPIDLATAHAAGVKACLARYGFGHAKVTDDMLRGDEWAIDRPQDLLGLVGVLT
ncbi:MAG: HAD family hydrolase [Vicinamibacterales bacterium]